MLTKGQIRESAIMELTWRGVKCWRQNNIAVRGRTFIGELGLPDIIGHHRQTGLFVGAEVKTITDKLSGAQKKFLADLKDAGGLSLIATEEKGIVVLKEFVL